MYAQINDLELKELATKKASGLATQLYLVLSSHCWTKNECFPSITRIKDMLGGAYHTNSIHRALKWLEDQGFIVRHAAKTTHRFVMKVRSLTKRLGKESNRLLKERREKKKNNLRYSSNRKHNNKNRFSNSSKQQITKDDRIQNWVEKALMYLDGQGDPPQKIQRDDVRAWMTGGQNAASMFWEPIRSNLGHLLV